MLLCNVRAYVDVKHLNRMVIRWVRQRYVSTGGSVSSRTSIVIPVYQNKDILQRFLTSLLASVRSNTEIVIINDGSGAASGRLIAHYSQLLRDEKNAETTVITHECPIGCGQSLNEGLRVASGDVILLADSDLVLRDHWQEHLENTLRDHPEAGMAGSVLVYPQTGGTQHAGIRFSSHVGRHWRLNAPPESLGTEPYDVQIAAFALFGMTRPVLDAVGRLDEQYVNGYEDFDFQMQARDAGFHTVIDPTRWSYHWERRNGPHRSSNRKGNLARFWLRWGSRIRPDLTETIADLVANLGAGNDICVLDLAESRLDADDVHHAVRSRLDGASYTVENLSHAIDDGASVCAALVVPRSVTAESQRYVLLVENFVRLLDNHMWLEDRLSACQDDIVIDLHGNQFPLKDFSVLSWPGTRVR